MREKGGFTPHRVASLRSQISQPAGKRETHNPSRTRIGDGGEALRWRNHGGSRADGGRWDVRGTSGRAVGGYGGGVVDQQALGAAQVAIRG
ncbi:hypothetical protein GOBAR_DD35480 [Gossypium barbadense]|nr:hypothetical protein GOBAR_DD35480 [Gossypium barbadense]